MTWTCARVRLPLHERGGVFLWDTYAVVCLTVLLRMGYSLKIQHAGGRIERNQPARPENFLQVPTFAVQASGEEKVVRDLTASSSCYSSRSKMSREGYRDNQTLWPAQQERIPAWRCEPGPKPTAPEVIGCGRGKCYCCLLTGCVVRLPFKYSCLCPLLVRVSIAVIKDRGLKHAGGKGLLRLTPHPPRSLTEGMMLEQN